VLSPSENSSGSPT
jgi:hypothetical protein